MPRQRPEVAALEEQTRVMREQLAAMRAQTEALERQNRMLEQLANPVIAAQAAERERTLDALAREPRRLSFFGIAAAIPGLPELFAGTVPAQFFTLVDTDTVEIACPCGAGPHAQLGRPAECACGRFFVYDGDTVRVAFGAKEGARD